MHHTFHVHTYAEPRPTPQFIWEQFQVIPHQVITGEQGKKYCETLPAPFERDDSEFSGGMPIEKTNIESLNLPCHNGLHIIKA